MSTCTSSVKHSPQIFTGPPYSAEIAIACLGAEADFHMIGVFLRLSVAVSQGIQKSFENLKNYYLVPVSSEIIMVW